MTIDAKKLIALADEALRRNERAAETNDLCDIRNACDALSDVRSALSPAVVKELAQAWMALQELVEHGGCTDDYSPDEERAWANARRLVGSEP